MSEGVGGARGLVEREAAAAAAPPIELDGLICGAMMLLLAVDVEWMNGS